MAKVSMRLVPDQDPDKIANLFDAYVKKICPKTVELKVTRMHGGKPWMTEFDNKYVRAAGKAIELGFGKDAGVQSRRRVDPGRVDVSAGARRAECVVRRRPARRERARTGREARSRQLPQRHHRVGVSLSGSRVRPVVEFQYSIWLSVIPTLLALAAARLRGARRAPRSRP
jgi:hypothetical protein